MKGLAKDRPYLAEYLVDNYDEDSRTQRDNARNAFTTITHRIRQIFEETGNWDDDELLQRFEDIAEGIKKIQQGVTINSMLVTKCSAILELAVIGGLICTAAEEEEFETLVYLIKEDSERTWDRAFRHCASLLYPEEKAMIEGGFNEVPVVAPVLELVEKNKYLGFFPSLPVSFEILAGRHAGGKKFEYEKEHSTPLRTPMSSNPSSFLSDSMSTDRPSDYSRHSRYSHNSRDSVDSRGVPDTRCIRSGSTDTRIDEELPYTYADVNAMLDEYDESGYIDDEDLDTAPIGN